MASYDDQFEATGYSSFSSVGSSPPAVQHQQQPSPAGYQALTNDNEHTTYADEFGDDDGEPMQIHKAEAPTQNNSTIHNVGNSGGDDGYGSDDFEDESPKLPITGASYELSSGGRSVPNTTGQNTGVAVAAANPPQVPAHTRPTPPPPTREEGNYDDDDFIRDDDGGESDSEAEAVGSAGGANAKGGKNDDDDPFDKLEKEYFESKQTLHRANRPMSAARGGSSSRPTTASAHRAPVANSDEISFAIPDVAGNNSITASPHVLQASLVAGDVVTTPRSSPHHTPVHGSSRLPLAPRSHSAANSYQQASPRREEEGDIQTASTSDQAHDGNQTNVTMSAMHEASAMNDPTTERPDAQEQPPSVLFPITEETGQQVLVPPSASSNSDAAFIANPSPRAEEGVVEKGIEVPIISTVETAKPNEENPAPQTQPVAVKPTIRPGTTNGKKPLPHAASKQAPPAVRSNVKSTTPPPPARRQPSAKPSQMNPSAVTPLLNTSGANRETKTSPSPAECRRPATSTSISSVTSTSKTASVARVTTNNATNTSSALPISTSTAGRIHTSIRPPTPKQRRSSAALAKANNSQPSGLFATVSSPVSASPRDLRQQSSILSDRTRQDQQLIYRFNQLLADLKMDGPSAEETLLQELKGSAATFVENAHAYLRRSKVAEEAAAAQDDSISSSSDDNDELASDTQPSKRNVVVKALALHQLTKQNITAHITPSPTLDSQTREQIESLSEDLSQLKSHTCVVVESIIKREEQVDIITALSEKYEHYPRYFNAAYSESLVSNHLDDIRMASEKVIAALDKWKEVIHAFDTKYKDDVGPANASAVGGPGLPPRLRPFPFLEYPNYITKMQQDLVFLYSTALGPYILIEVENNVLLANRKRTLIDREKLKAQQQAQLERKREKNGGLSMITGGNNSSFMSVGDSVNVSVAKPTNNFSIMFGGGQGGNKEGRPSTATAKAKSATTGNSTPPLMALTAVTANDTTQGVTNNSMSANSHSQTLAGGTQTPGTPVSTAHLGFFGDFSGRIPVLSSLTPDMVTKYAVTSKDQPQQAESQHHLAEALFGRDVAARRSQSPSRYDPRRANSPNNTSNSIGPHNNSISGPQPAHQKPEPILPRAVSPTQLREHYFFARLSAPAGTSVVRREAGNLGGEGQHLEDMKLVAEVERPSNSWFRGLTAMIVPMRSTSKGMDITNGPTATHKTMGKKAATPEPGNNSYSGTAGDRAPQSKQRPQSAFAMQASKQRSALRDRLRSIHEGVLEGKVPAYHTSIMNNSSYTATPYNDRGHNDSTGLPPPNPNNSTMVMVKPDNTSFLTMDKQRRMTYLKADDRYTSVLSMRRVAKDGLYSNTPKYDGNGRRIMGGGAWGRRASGTSEYSDEIHIDGEGEDDEDQVSKVPPPVGSRPGSAAAHYAAVALRHRKNSDGSNNSRSIGQRKNLPRHAVATTNRDLLRDMRRYEDSHHFWADFLFTVAMCKFWGRKLRKRGRDGRFAIKIQRWWRDILTRERFFVLIEEAFIHSFRPRRERAALWLVPNSQLQSQNQTANSYLVAVPPIVGINSGSNTPSAYSHTPSGMNATALLTLLTFSPDGDIVGEEKIDRNSHRFKKVTEGRSHSQSQSQSVTLSNSRCIAARLENSNSKINGLLTVDSEGEDGDKTPIDELMNARNPNKLDDQFFETFYAIADHNADAADEDAEHDEDYTSEDEVEEHDEDGANDGDNSPFDRTRNDSSIGGTILALGASHADAANTVEELLAATRLDKAREIEAAKALLSPRSTKRAAAEAEAKRVQTAKEKLERKAAKLERRERRRARRMGRDVEAQLELHHGAQSLNSADKLLASANFHFGASKNSGHSTRNSECIANPSPPSTQEPADHFHYNHVEELDVSLKELMQPRRLAALGAPVDKGSKWIHEFLYDVVVRQMQYEDSLREEERTSIRWQNYRVAQGKAHRGWVEVTCVTLKPVVTEVKVGVVEELLDDEMIPLENPIVSIPLVTGDAQIAKEREMTVDTARYHHGSKVDDTTKVDGDDETYSSVFDEELPPALAIEEPTLVDFPPARRPMHPIAPNSTILSVDIADEHITDTSRYRTGLVLSCTQHTRDIEMEDYHLFSMNVLSQLQLQNQQEESRRLRQELREARRQQKLREREDLNRSAVAKFLAGASASGNNSSGSRPLSALEMIRKKRDSTNPHLEENQAINATSEYSTTRPPSHNPDGSVTSDDEGSMSVDMMPSDIPRIACHILVTTRKSVYPFIAPKATRRHPFRDNIIATYYHYSACSDIIKRAIRHYICRKQMPHNIAACKAMVKIQRFYHHLFNRRTLQREIKVRIAARTIFEGYCYWKQRRAAIKVCREVRASNVMRHGWLIYSAKRQLERLRLERDSATTIQRRLRGMLGRAKASKAKHCQTILRFLWVRSVTRPITGRKMLEKAAVTAIQRKFRSFSSKCHAERKKTANALALAEHLLRDGMVTQDRAVQRIAAAFRGYTTRRDLEILCDCITNGAPYPTLAHYRWGHVRAVASESKEGASASLFQTMAVPLSDLRYSTPIWLREAEGLANEANYFVSPRLVTKLQMLRLLHLRKSIQLEYEHTLRSSHTVAKTFTIGAEGERVPLEIACTVPGTYESTEGLGSPDIREVSAIATLNPNRSVHRSLVVRIQCFLRKTSAKRTLLQLREDKRRRQRYFALWCVNARFSFVFGQDCAKKAAVMWKLTLLRAQAKKTVLNARELLEGELHCLRREEAALTIQRNWRRPSMVENAKTLAEHLEVVESKNVQCQVQNEAAVVLQTALSNHWNHQKLRRTMQVRQRTAADKLARWWKILLSERQLCEARYEHLKLQEKAALEIQLFWSACKKRKAAQLRKRAREAKYSNITALVKSRPSSRNNSPPAPARSYVVTSGVLPLRTTKLL